MKRLVKIFLIFLVISIIASFSKTNFAQKEDPVSGSNSENAFAVVELFTSEGCSSCPPADKLLGEIISEAREKEQSIYGLAFHVDYWDYIGWKDPYANPAFSERQQKYAASFNSRRIYTPQMIVNGRKEFVGSNRSTAKKAINSALKESAKIGVTLKLLKNPGKDKLVVSYKLSEIPKDAVLNVALVEGGLVQQVSRGENSGRKLTHENVVRAFNTERLTKLNGQVEFDLKEITINLSGGTFIGYLQNRKTMKIIAATQILLSGSMPNGI